MYSYYNPHPSKNRIGDCVIRALTKALNKSWHEVYVDLCILGYVLCDWGSSNSVWNSYLISQGFTRDIVSADCPDCYTIEDFCMEHPQGTYVIGTGSHAVAVVDGILFDSWNSLGEIAIYFYKKGE